PGGGTTAAQAAALAFRGACALQAGQVPEGCTANSDGSVTFSGLTGDTAHNLAADITGNSALFGFWVHPASNFRASVNVDLFSADHAYTRITPRLLRHYRINASYTPIHWAEITGDADIVDSSDNVSQVQDVEHNRSYSIATVFTPSSRFTFDVSYNYNNIYTQAFDCFAASGLPAGFLGVGVPSNTAANPASPITCPLVDPDGNPSPVNIGAISTYKSISNFAYADMMVQPVKQLTFTVGYAANFVRGTTSWFNPTSLVSVNFLNPLTPWGPLRFNYQLPYVTMNWDVYKGLSYVATWNYYGYNTRANNNPAGLIPLGTQDFNGNNMTLSAKYTF
ncbi:MAG: hypothetical protein KGL59_08775, partial [Acidobacteriota bacterium]|nr:hypothetical protein [Acidobacteriota bacterium]